MKQTDINGTLALVHYTLAIGEHGNKCNGHLGFYKAFRKAI